MGDFYEELLEGLKPLPETVPWLLEQGELGKEEILYQQEYTWDPLTGMRERSVRCICTACQGTWYTTKVHVNGCSLGYAPAPFGFMAVEEQVRVYHGETTVCPCCGAEALAIYTGREPPGRHRRPGQRHRRSWRPWGRSWRRRTGRRRRQRRSCGPRRKG